MVRNQGYTADVFFIFAASGTSDFVYISFKAQIEAMASNEMFTMADNEQEGNPYFLEKEGYSHDGYAAMTYFYNGLTWLFKDSNDLGSYATNASVQTESQISGAFTLSSAVQSVIEDEAFGDYGRLLFPVDRSIDENATLEEIQGIILQKDK